MEEACADTGRPRRTDQVHTGGSAVYPAPEVTYYWLCYQRPGKSESDDTVTYYIEAKVLGQDEEAAEAELLELAENWEIPG